MGTFAEKEYVCELEFSSNAPFWHMTTPGASNCCLFASDADFEYGISMIGICLALVPGLKLYSYALMNNHVHFIFSGKIQDCLYFFEQFRLRMRRYAERKKLSGVIPVLDWPDVQPDPAPIPITDLNMLRNEICYVARNGYVVNSAITPFSDYKCSGSLYFNPYYKLLPAVPCSKLKFRENRLVSSSRQFKFPDSYEMVSFRGDIADFPETYFISPLSYCCVASCERMFRDAHHYFNLLSRNHEANSEIAKRLQDNILVTDEEMYSAVQGLAFSEYKVKNPVELSISQKFALAKKMFFEYKASRGQIRRILRLSESDILEILPKTES